MTEPIDIQADLLVNWFSGLTGAIVAFSGGVDSAVVAQAAHVALADRALAVTADSPSLSHYELEQACELALSIGVRHQIVQTDEIHDADYAKNDGQRCFHCKSHLFTKLQAIRREIKTDWVIVTGTNRDDLSDYRPGLRAAADFEIRSPLAELGISKTQVRKLAAHWSLPVADKPASPCLASRIAYGVEVTAERLSMIEQAESFVRALGIPEFRVRLHSGEIARIEVGSQWLTKLVQPEVRHELSARLRAIGFKYVTLDLEGFRSGNLNQLVTMIE